MIPNQEHQDRRRKLALKLPAGSVALIPAAKERIRNNDTQYRFRQDSDFFYLTGFNEPDALLIVLAGTNGESILFNRPRHFAEEQWTGLRLGQEGAKQHLGVQFAYPLSELQTQLAQWFADKTAVYYPIGRYPDWDRLVLDTWHKVNSAGRQDSSSPEQLGNLSPLLSEMRLIKSPAEMDCMRRAVQLSVAAHQRAMQACHQARFEYELEAEISYELTRQGCRSVAYDSIVAAGHNACVLHYTNNDQPLVAGDLVLIDAGGEYHNYAADITRTFPINGTFSPEQKLIYELVLNAQKAGIARVRPGCLWDDIQQTIVKILTAGLVDLGLLQGPVEDLIAQAAYRPFYMHRSGHWLGLDVHDVGHYKEQGQWRALQPGMVLTVEPGLYIHESITGIDSRWHGIGVRIEDDILVTAQGHENLSGALATEISDLEALVRG